MSENLGFYLFGNATIIFFCMMIEANTVQHLDQVLGFKIDNPGISRGLDIQI